MADEVEQGRDLDRVAAFSDGVFAIAITVLVLTLDFPKFGAARPIDEILDGLWKPVLTYFLSFYVIGVYWFAHHRMWHFIHRIDSTFIALNMLLLSFVAIMPFPTDLLGDYGDTGQATIIYAVTVAATGLASVAVWWYAARENRLTKRDMPEGFRSRMIVRGLVAPVVFLVSIPVAIFDPDLAKLCWLLVIPVRIATMRNYGNVYEM
jgi:uncharacterized membrane protein